MQQTGTSGNGQAPPTGRVGRSGAAGGSGANKGSGAWVLFVLFGVLLLLVGGIVALLVKGASGSTVVYRAGANTVKPGPTMREAVKNQRALEDARDAFVQGDYARAAGVLEAAIRNDARDQELRLLDAQALSGLKDYRGAYQQMEAAIAIGPAGPELHFDAGTIANQAGLVDRALEHYSMAQSANPREPRYPLYLGMIQIKLGDDDKARASLVRAVTLQPDLAEGWGTLGEMELKSNSLGLALDHFRKAKTLQPAAVRWRLGEARVLKRQGDAEGALTLLTALDEKDRVAPAVLGALAECYGLLGKPREAAEAYAKATVARPDDAEAHYQAAVWFQKAGDVESARKHARRAKELGHDRAAELLGSM